MNTLLVLSLALLVGVAVFVVVRRSASKGVNPSSDEGPPEAREDGPLAEPDVQGTVRSYRVGPGSLGETRAARGNAGTASAYESYQSGVLEIADGPSAGSSFELLKMRTYIGRARDNHVVLDDPKISFRHAAITVRDGVYWLEDLGSTNGTFAAEDSRVMEPAPLRDGDAIRLGATIVIFHGSQEGGS